MDDNKTVLCGANAYEKKYYFNEMFANIPESIKDELRIICTLFTEEVGGVFMLVFDEDGNVCVETDADEEDILYDEIGSGLLAKEVVTKRRELFESLNMFYRVFVLHENLEDIES